MEVDIGNPQHTRSDAYLRYSMALGRMSGHVLAL
jgi:hypothetical protein